MEKPFDYMLDPELFQELMTGSFLQRVAVHTDLDQFTEALRSNSMPISEGMERFLNQLLLLLWCDHRGRRTASTWISAPTNPQSIIMFFTRGMEFVQSRVLTSWKHSIIANDPSPAMLAKSYDIPYISHTMIGSVTPQGLLSWVPCESILAMIRTFLFAFNRAIEKDPQKEAVWMVKFMTGLLNTKDYIGEDKPPRIFELLRTLQTGCEHRTDQLVGKTGNQNIAEAYREAGYNKALGDLGRFLDP